MNESQELQKPQEQQEKYHQYKKRFYDQTKKKSDFVNVMSRKTPDSTKVPCGRWREVVDDENEYKMNHPRRGRLLIINNHFKGDEKLKREGTVVDEENLKKVFVHCLGFNEEDITSLHDLTCEQILIAVDQEAEKNYTDHACVIVVVMTHGKEDLLMGEDEFETHVTVDDISEPFQFNETLLGKPKIFIFQACRGSGSMKPCEITLETDANFGILEMSQNRVPVYPDFLFAFSTPQSFISWQDQVEGSWFIQSLCSAITSVAVGQKKEIMEILTIANRRLSEMHSDADDEEPYGYYQVASIESTLLKELYFENKSQAGSSGGDSPAIVDIAPLNLEDLMQL